VEFLQDYTFILKRKARVENKIANALSRCVIILVVMNAEVIGFERLREGHESCPDFEKIYVTLRDDSVREMDDFLLQDGYLFRFRKVCFSHMFFKDLLSWEIHAGGLTGYFGQNKTIEAVELRFY